MNHPAIRDNAVAVITGAAVGIGYAIAERLAKEGMKLVLFDRDQHKLNNAKTQLVQAYSDLEISIVYGDVTSRESLADLFQAATKLGDIALLINNAAILKGAGPWHDLTQWRQTMDVNFWNILEIQSLFVEHLITQSKPAAIVNLGSKEGITTPPGNAAYSVSKAGVKVLTEQLAHELRQLSGSTITAHLLVPGYTFTPMNFPEMKDQTQKPNTPWTAAQVADRLVEGLNKQDFYIFCQDNEVTEQLDHMRMQWAADDMIKNRPALSRWHSDYKEAFQRYIEEGCK